VAKKYSPSKQCHVAISCDRVFLCPPVCLSVCLSQVGVLLKQLIAGSCKQLHMIAQGLFLTPKILAKLNRNHPNGGAKCRWGRLNAGMVAENWRHSTQSVISFVWPQVYPTERPPSLFVCSTFAVMQHVAPVCQRQLIQVYHELFSVQVTVESEKWFI